jgi:hypothetical protein
MNLASLTGSRYEQVTVNSISFAPHLLINISLLALNEEDSGRHRLEIVRALAASQDTLLELSGVPFNLISFLSSASLLVPKKTAVVSAGRDGQQARDEEALFYLGVGAAVALLLALCLLLCVLHSIRHPLLHPDGGKQPPPNFRYNDPPTAIYTEQFVSSNNKNASSSDGRSERHRRSGAGAFTPLDDNLYPVATEVDFTPRYLLDLQEPEMDMAASCYRSDSPMPELTRLLAAEDGDDEEEVGDVTKLFLNFLMM